MKTYKTRAAYTKAIQSAKLGNTQEQAVSKYLESIGIDFTSRYLHEDGSEDWPCYKHMCVLSNKTTKASECFEFSKGLGHAIGFLSHVYINPVLAAELLFSVILDGYAGEATHSEWCSDFGYDEDSRKGLEIYLACQSNYDKLLKVLTRSQIDKVTLLLEDY